MNKQELEQCKEIIKCFDKAIFNLPAPDMVQISLKIMNFGKMIQSAEADLAKPPVAAEPAPVVVANAPRKPRVRKENPIKVE